MFLHSAGAYVSASYADLHGAVAGMGHDVQQGGGGGVETTLCAVQAAASWSVPEIVKTGIDLIVAVQALALPWFSESGEGDERFESSVAHLALGMLDGQRADKAHR
ncbi:hypothetical protein GCM10023193_67880 [Planotetraspora kaengkrachanensis]|uniref:Uncharacterized protein n=1 Tax=Planotetraspora kaengkrachanensis TaxID=575193 RepID=A0A8J3M9M3_9ACTN|nr:hypothetical protein Pka01_39920 [Planotetraspora kaengkrachanensis]